jgi:transcriptional regulator with XRE-family HTH domain
VSVAACNTSSLGQLARERRLELGLSVVEVARRTGLSRSTIHRLERGQHVARHIGRLVAVALDLPVFLIDPNAKESSDARS